MEINLVLADCSLLLATLKCHNDSISIFFIGLLRSLEEVKMAVWIWFYCSWNLKPPTSLFYVLQIEDLHHLLQAIWLMPICFFWSRIWRLAVPFLSLLCHVAPWPYPACLHKKHHSIPKPSKNLVALVLSGYQTKRIIISPVSQPNQWHSNELLIMHSCYYTAAWSSSQLQSSLIIIGISRRHRRFSCVCATCNCVVYR